jgi:2-isopropylmalate synthase
MNPQSIGWPSSSFVLGKLSGRAGLRSRLEELGYKMSREELNDTFEAFKELADRKREVTDADLAVLMSSSRRTTDIPETYTLEHVQVSCGNHEIPTATVTLTVPDGASVTDAATGTGPVDAVYKAINRIVKVSHELTEFRVNSVTEGIDAMGDVTIRIRQEDQTFVGRGANTDIIVASAEAYMNALNRLLALGDSPRNVTGTVTH